VRALSFNQKESLYKSCVYGRLRFIAKPGYDFIIGLILFGNRIIDLFHQKDRTDISDLTIIIKTFERHKAVQRLVYSIKRRYPEAIILVVNDSKEPEDIDGVDNLILPYDVGISAGRNAALDSIRTKYFLLLDDDFVFSRRQKLGLLVLELERYTDIDIIGGRYIDLPFFIIHNFQDVPIQSTLGPKIPIDTMFGKNRVVDKVQNYFIARTESVEKIKWNEALKVSEHTDFFTRAKGNLTTTFREDMFILHAKTPFDLVYLAKRFRSVQR
jgi:glycosyltransferase involved in cell wall biosynthesis